LFLAMQRSRVKKLGDGWGWWCMRSMVCFVMAGKVGMGWWVFGGHLAAAGGVLAIDWLSKGP